MTDWADTLARDIARMERGEIAELLRNIAADGPPDDVTHTPVTPFCARPQNGLPDLPATLPRVTTHVHLPSGPEWRENGEPWNG